MIIEYEISKYVKENKQIEILDTKNVFLKGKNPYDNMDTYFGVWINDNNLSIVTIKSWHTISYKSYLNTNLDTESDIQEYLNNNKNVTIITRDEFKEQIDNIRSILKV